MKSFEYSAPKTVKEATRLLGDAWGKTEVMAGGTDLVTSLKQGVTEPDRIVSLKNIKELRGIDGRRGGVRLGAMATLGQLVADSDVKKHFPALVTAAEGIASPQILSMGTVGGDLCQRPRCWYFRNGFGLFARHGDISLAREGDNRYHAILGNDGPALFVSPSSLGPALVALGAEITLVGPSGQKRKIPAREFFQTPQSEADRETALKPNEILTEVFVPIRGLKNATYEVRHRHGLDWPYVTASVAFRSTGPSAAEALIVLGHVAPVPWTARNAANALNGAKVDATSAARCGEVAVEGARALSGNSYKIQMVKAAVKRAVLAAAAA